MTKGQQDKLRRALYNAKFTTDAEDENPFVGIYFNDLLDIIHDFGQQHPNWIPVEEELPKRMSEGSRFSDTVLVYNEDGYKDTAYYDYEEKIWRWMPRITHWMEIQPPRKEE